MKIKLLYNIDHSLAFAYRLLNFVSLSIGKCTTHGKHIRWPTILIVWLVVRIVSKLFFSIFYQIFFKEQKFPVLFSNGGVWWCLERINQKKVGSDELEPVFSFMVHTMLKIKKKTGGLPPCFVVVFIVFVNSSFVISCFFLMLLFYISNCFFLIFSKYISINDNV